MSDLSTALRAFLTRRLDPTRVYSYAVLFGLVAAVVVTGAMIVTGRRSGDCSRMLVGCVLHHVVARSGICH